MDDRADAGLSRAPVSGQPGPLGGSATSEGPGPLGGSATSGGLGALGGADAAFAGDDGSVPGPVAAALDRWSSGALGIGDLVTTLAAHRVLVPLLEVDADLLEGDDADPCAGQDRAVAAVSLRSDEGVVGMAFTGMVPLMAWNPAARPMPVEATRVAAAVLAEGGVALLVDPAGPHPVRVAGAALQRLAAGAAWPQPWRDPAVQSAVVGVLGPALAAGEVAVRLAAPSPDASEDGPEDGRAAALVVELRFPADLPARDAAARAGAVADRLGASADLRAVFDGTLAVRVV